MKNLLGMKFLEEKLLKENNVYNFGAGPAALPKELMQEVQSEFLDWQGTGLSILEYGHRTVPFLEMMTQAEQDLRLILDIPENYYVLFLGMPARMQFAMLPLNLLNDNFNANNKKKGAYLVSGTWSKLALQEAKLLKKDRTYCLATSEYSSAKYSAQSDLGKNAYIFDKTPNVDGLSCLEDTSYIYYTPNETIQGIAWPEVPYKGQYDLLVDMTSCLLSHPISVKDYACIFAGVQKNIAPAGLTLVIIRKDLVECSGVDNIPSMLNYKVHIEHQPSYATPPVFSCYFAAKMFSWIKAQGGLDALGLLNQKKAQILYDYIDNSDYYVAPIKAPYRSIQNICFYLRDSHLDLHALTKKFIDDAEKAGLHALKGHRIAGGCRASLYNAMPIEGVYALINFMEQFRGFN